MSRTFATTTTTTQTERSGLNCESEELNNTNRTSDQTHDEQSTQRRDGLAQELRDGGQIYPHFQLQTTGSEQVAVREPKDGDSQSVTSSASGVESQIYLGIYTGTRAEIKKGRHGVLRMLIDELIYEAGESAFAAGAESDTERVMETDSGVRTRLMEMGSG